MKDKIKLAEWAVEQAKKAGADEVAVNITNRRDIDIEYRDAKLEKLKESTQNSLSIRIYTDHRYSSNSTNDLRQDSLVKFIQESVAGTKYLAQDEYRSLPDPKFYPTTLDADLDICDNSYDKLTAEQRVSIARDIEQAAMGVSDKILSSTAGFGDVSFETVKVHSNGFVGKNKGTVFSCGAEATVQDPNGGRPEDWFYATSRYFNDLPSADELGTGAVKRALAKIGQTKIESGRYTMLVENRAGGRLLGTLRGAMTGSAIQQKRSFLDGKLGEQIASPLFSVIDDPFMPRGLGSRLYDGSGLATQKRAFIDKGVLKAFFIDDYYAKKLEVEPTVDSPSNLVFAYGRESMQQMLKKIDKGILVTGFIGGNSNSTTGDFSFGITGMLIENGELVKPLNEMNISGNALEFWKQLSAVGNDPYLYSSVQLPSLQFDQVEFSGI